MRSHRTTIIPNTETPSKPEGFWTNLVKDDNNFSTVNFFLIAAVIVGIIMLIVPMVGLCVDIYYNHTITVNMDALAAYIIAVAGVWGAAGLTNAWTEYSYQKYNSNIFSGETPQPKAKAMERGRAIMATIMPAFMSKKNCFAL